MSTVTIPRADIPIGEKDASGQFIASRDLYRWMRDITARVGGVTALSLGDVLEEVSAAKSLAGMAFTLGSEAGEDGLPGPKGDRGEIGPIGPAGSGGDGSATLGQHFLMGDPSDPEPAFPGVRGADGAAGSAGARGADGNPGAMFTIDVPEPEFAIPGARGGDGAAGAAGGAGAQGLAGAALFMIAEPPDPEIAWPGPAGATGATGAPGGGGGSATTVEANLGATALCCGKFTITDAAIASTSKVLAWQAPGPYTGKGTRADEAQMQPVQVIAVAPATGSAIVYWQTPPMLLQTQPVSFDTGNLTNVLKDRQKLSGGPAIRAGKVRGNVKFSYLAFS